MEPLRCFVAIEIPPPIKSLLAQLQQGLRAEGGGKVKWVEVGGIHLTLKFLGNVVSEKVPAIIHALSSVGQSATPFSLALGEMGVFPNPRRTQVIWVGLKGDLGSLQELAQGVERALSPLGFPAENRPFTPHLTLGRVREDASPGERTRLGEKAMATRTAPAPPFEVSRFNLMRSQLTPQGAIYTPLASIPLGASEKTP